MKISPSFKNILQLLFLVTLGLSFIALTNLSGFLRARKHSQATRALEDLRIIDRAINQYAIEFKKQPGDLVSWQDIQPHLKSKAKLYESGGLDLLGNPYRLKEFGTKPKVSEETYNALSDVAPKDFWSPYY